MLAGCKGRTGMMASVLLVEAGLLQNVSESITYVKNNGKREQKTSCRRAFEVVGTPSQVAAIEKVEAYLNHIRSSAFLTVAVRFIFRTTEAYRGNPNNGA